MSRKWTEEQKKAASEAYAKRKAGEKSKDASDRMRIPLGGKRDMLSVKDTPDGYVDRIVNDLPGRIDRFKDAGYELVESAQLGSSHVDGSQSESGVVSKDVGKGQTAYLMRQRKEFFDEDQAAKQQKILDAENDLRKKKVNPNESTDGTYGEVTIG